MTPRISACQRSMGRGGYDDGGGKSIPSKRRLSQQSFPNRALTKLPQFAKQTAPGDSAAAVFSGKSSLQFHSLQTARQRQAQLVKQDGLVFRRLADTSFAQFPTASRRQNHVHRLHRRDLVQNLSWLVAQAGGFAHLAQHLP